MLSADEVVEIVPMQELGCRVGVGRGTWARLIGIVIGSAPSITPIVNRARLNDRTLLWRILKDALPIPSLRA
jgi:hypothetical protein